MSQNDEPPKPSASPQTPGIEESDSTGSTQRHERRSYPRTWIDVPASVKVLNPMASSSGRIEGRVVNISKNGLRLRIPQPMLPGTTVQVRFMDQIGFGEVRYCIPSGSDHSVGIRLQDVIEIP